MVWFDTVVQLRVRKPFPLAPNSNVKFVVCQDNVVRSIDFTFMGLMRADG